MRARIALSFLVLCLLPVHPSRALPEPDPPVRYVLSAETEYEEGCFDACACPILLAADVEGTFGLAAIEPEGAWQRYAVSGVVWEVVFLGEPFRRAVGEGTYRADPVGKLQQLVLDLKVDDREVTRFDSGIVPLEAEWPALDVTISRNGMFCFDEVWYVHAAPADPIFVDREVRWGAWKAVYR